MRSTCGCVRVRVGRPTPSFRVKLQSLGRSTRQVHQTSRFSDTSGAFKLAVVLASFGFSLSFLLACSPLLLVVGLRGLGRGGDFDHAETADEGAAGEEEGEGGREDGCH
eukprot:1267478-Rhodomonas_salina.3